MAIILDSAVVGLADVADQSRRRRHVHVGAGLLLLEIGRRGAADVKRAVQVHVDHRLPFLRVHLEEHAIAQDAGVVDDAVDAAEVVDGGFDDGVGAHPARDAVGVGHRLAARSADFVHHFLRRPGVLAFAAYRCADVVHHDFGTLGRHQQRELAADAAARSGHHHDLLFHHVCHLALLKFADKTIMLSPD
jgi:hypothetical protein